MHMPLQIKAYHKRVSAYLFAPTADNQFNKQMHAHIRPGFHTKIFAYGSTHVYICKYLPTISHLIAWSCTIFGNEAFSYA